MSKSVEPVRFDFRKQSRLSTSKKENCRLWFEAFVRDFSEKWNQLASVESQMKFSEQATLRFDSARSDLREPAVANEFFLGDDRSVRAILALDRSIALAMIFSMLGQQTDDGPDDRQLSEIELSVGELLIQKILESIADSWPQRDRLAYTVSPGLDLQPHKSRLCEPRQKVFVCRFELQVGEKVGQLKWVLPLEELDVLLDSLDVPEIERSEEAQEQMKKNVHGLPVSVSVALGNTSVSVAELTALSVGDVVVLEQRIGEPLPLLVDNKPKFSGWLGRNGNRHAFKISGSK